MRGVGARRVAPKEGELLDGRWRTLGTIGVGFVLRLASALDLSLASEELESSTKKTRMGLGIGLIIAVPQCLTCINQLIVSGNMLLWPLGPSRQAYR